MATLMLSAAGSTVGAYFGAPMLGRAAGAVAGGMIDQQVIGRGAQAVETGRVDGLRIQGASEGAVIPRLFGRMRVAGEVIWSSRFLAHVDSSRRGAKGGGQKVKEFSYTISLAISLCEGKIDRIGRVWVDGVEVSLDDIEFRLHLGGEDQLPDPVIEQTEGSAPAFRGLAYIVFEDLPLGRFGNRIPQFNFEVYRKPEAADQATGDLDSVVRAVALSPGSGEFSLETQPVRRLEGPGREPLENVNSNGGATDIVASLDILETDAPACEAVSLIVSWFGDDLRAAQCKISPMVERADKATAPVSWRVSGFTRETATVVSEDGQGCPVYGGTPSDASVIAAIQELNDRGKKVMFYPFILMDVPPGNQRPDPYRDAAYQPAFPWRGRITTSIAAGRPGTPDKTNAAADEVDAFFGSASAADFAVSGESVTYTGPEDRGFGRFILHYAHLCAVAGGVEAFCIGSELRGLTQIRSAVSSYPFVSRLIALAADVRSILGGDAKIGYAADWSEYFGHQPGDGDILFHLDPLWSDSNIDFIGIDNYLPLSDWRYSDTHADAAAGAVYNQDYLAGNVEGGEGYDWFYASENDRKTQTRTPIVDTAHGEDWIFRPKDIRGWWGNLHHNRIGGVRSPTPTGWMPETKPIWFTEIGCPAVDLGANQPNVFVDPKSSESTLPYFSRGIRDDFMQRAYLASHIGYWTGEGVNPVSGVTNEPMIDLSRLFIWTWDARPWPDFPLRRAVWSDGDNYPLGHWISGRLSTPALSDVVADICDRAGLYAYDVSDLYGGVEGLLHSDGMTPRQLLQPLMTTHRFDAVEANGVLKFRHRDQQIAADIDSVDVLLSADNAPEISFTRMAESDLPAAVQLTYIQSENEYERGALEVRADTQLSSRVEATSAPIAMNAAKALSVAESWMTEVRAGREGAEISAPPSMLALEPGDIVRLAGSPAQYRIDRLDDGLSRAMTLTKVETQFPTVSKARERALQPAPIDNASPVVHHLMDLPVLVDPSEAQAVAIAAFSEPWGG